MTFDEIRSPCNSSSQTFSTAPARLRARLAMLNGTGDVACWIRRSITVGMPSSRSPPSGLGIVTRRTGLGRYVPDNSPLLAMQGFGEAHAAQPNSIKRHDVRRDDDIDIEARVLETDRNVRALGQSQ
jgi:hypothetical protein